MRARERIAATTEKALLDDVRDNLAPPLARGEPCTLEVADQLIRTRHRLALDLHVVDNGPGIPDELKDRIFFPLVSGRDNGTGLGLTLAQTFIQQHDGTIEVESRPGRSDFRILIPLH